MDIKIETTGGWPIKSEGRARKTTRGEGFTTITASARVIVSGPDAWQFGKESSLASRLERDGGVKYLPDTMKQWLGLGAEVVVTTGGFSNAGQNGQYIFDFGFKMTKRGRGHANYAKQFRGILTELDRSGELQKVGELIVLDEMKRVEMARSNEARSLRMGSVAAYLVSSAREQAEILMDYRIKLHALRKEREDKMRELCPDTIIEELATEHDLPLDDFRQRVEAELVGRVSPYGE